MPEGYNYIIYTKLVDAFAASVYDFTISPPDAFTIGQIMPPTRVLVYKSVMDRIEGKDQEIYLSMVIDIIDCLVNEDGECAYVGKIWGDCPYPLKPGLIIHLDWYNIAKIYD
jgi:hypothetical protein